MRSAAAIAALGLLIGYSSYVLAETLGDCVNDSDYSSYTSGVCNNDGPTRCQTLTTGTCGDWNEGAVPPKPSQKKWTTNMYVGTCVPPSDSLNHPKCGICADGVWCASGKKYANLDDCQAEENPIASIYGYCTGVCVKTTYDTDD